MLFADTMAIFFVVLGLLIAFPSLWLLCSGLFPGFVERTTAAAEKQLWKSFLIGIPVTALSVFLIVVVGKLPASFGQIGGTLTFGTLMFFAQCGVAGIAALLGKRLRSPADLDRPWKGTLRGGIVLVLSYLLPLLGWFLILPVSVIIGAGSATRACFSGRKRVATQTAATENSLRKTSDASESSTAQNVKLSLISSEMQNNHADEIAEAGESLKAQSN